MTWRMLRGRRTGAARRAVAALAIACGIACAGCTSTLSNLPIVGEPDHLPKRPDAPGEFPAVHDMPVPRDTKPLSEADRKKLEADLAAARDRQEAATATTPKKPPNP